MERSTVSVCHSLKLVPLSSMTRFARFASCVIMELLGEVVDAEAVPGTIKVTTTTESGKIKKKIPFERSDVSETTANLLGLLKALRLVAIYTDESGKRRVAGSPDWPLSMEYVAEGGVFTVTLQGEDVNPDGFLTD